MWNEKTNTMIPTPARDNLFFFAGSMGFTATHTAEYSLART